MPKKCSNGYICISDEEQSRIWEIYDNIEEIAKCASGADYEDCKKEFNMLAEQIKELKNILNIKEII
jgi:hypothetical protein